MGMKVMKGTDGEQKQKEKMEGKKNRRKKMEEKKWRKKNGGKKMEEKKPMMLFIF